MIDDRVWTVRFRRELADLLRERARAEDLTVQQVIVRAVVAALGAAAPESAGGQPAKRDDQDTYKYG